MSDNRMVPATRRVVWSRSWPWLILALATLPAVYRVLDYPSDIDPEYPQVFRPTFNRLPPLAYRLAEPGDRLDQLALWLAAGGMATAARGWLRRRRSGQPAALWPAALGLSAAAFWYAAVPSPAPDGWHGLGWASIADPSTPITQRLILAAVALGFVMTAGLSAWKARGPFGELRARGFVTGNAALIATAAILAGCRLADVPAIEPAGYWPRWAMVWSLLAWDIALVRATGPARYPEAGSPPARFRLRRLTALTGWGTAWTATAAAGLAVAWYHRPIERFTAVVPGKVYICAMPTYRGLSLAFQRHGFKTIINLFPEEGPWRSPRLPDELRFAREHGIQYISNPGEQLEPTVFIEQTLAVARDPSAWPVLVHCHACYDRTPAWAGIYRFVVLGRPLDVILRDIEKHRGARPKASVTLLYNRVLAALAPAQCALDATIPLLRQYAAGATLPTHGDRPTSTDGDGTDGVGF